MSSHAPQSQTSGLASSVVISAPPAIVRIGKTPVVSVETALVARPAAHRG